jgi:hypothetical protein
MKGTVASFVFAFCHSVLAQGTFENLNFEEANPVMINGSPYVTAASALPYWTAAIGGVQQSQLTENDPSVGAPWVMLVGPGFPYYSPLDGNYSVFLQGSGVSALPSISQTGTIPAGTESLLFDAQTVTYNGNLVR